MSDYWAKAEYYKVRLAEVEVENSRMRTVIEWILDRHKMDNPPWRCACDICEACRKGLGIE